MPEDDSGIFYLDNIVNLILHRVGGDKLGHIAREFDAVEQRIDDAAVEIIFEQLIFHAGNLVSTIGHPKKNSRIFISISAYNVGCSFLAASPN